MEPPLKRPRHGIRQAPRPAPMQFGAPATPGTVSARGLKVAHGPPPVPRSIPRISSRATFKKDSMETVNMQYFLQPDPSREFGDLLFTYFPTEEWTPNQREIGCHMRPKTIGVITLKSLMSTVNGIHVEDHMDKLKGGIKTAIETLVSDDSISPKKFADRVGIIGIYNKGGFNADGGDHLSGPSHHDDFMGSWRHGFQTMDKGSRAKQKRHGIKTVTVSGMALLNDITNTEVHAGTNVFVVIYKNAGGLRIATFAHYKYERPEQHPDFYTKCWSGDEEPVVWLVGRVQYDPKTEHNYGPGEWQDEVVDIRRKMTVIMPVLSV